MKLAAFFDNPPGDDCIVGFEQTDHGWRGLTRRGDVLVVRSRDGSKAAIPEGDVVMAQRVVATSPSASVVNIGDYLAHYDRAIALTRQNRNVEALAESDAAMALAPTLFARFNRALILLALGRWREGFAEYRECERRPPFIRVQTAEALAAGLTPWNGEDIAGKRLLLIHAHGFGDTIMMLRYVSVLRARGADVTLHMPAELERLAEQFGCLITRSMQSADFFCPMLHLIGLLQVEPDNIPRTPYLDVDNRAVQAWRAKLGRGPHIGIAWSPGGGGSQNAGDYPRTIALDRIVDELGEAQLHSVQKHGAVEARALGVHVHDFEDFADCAALMMAMDRVVSVDTAALHLAGAIGHPRVDGLLSDWSSWRWRACWYRDVRLTRMEVFDG